MLRWTVTMISIPFTRQFQKLWLFILAVSACCQKLLVTQIVTMHIRDYGKYQYSGNWGKKVVLYLLDKVWSQWLRTNTIRNGLIDSSEVVSFVHRLACHLCSSTPLCTTLLEVLFYSFCCDLFFVTVDDKKHYDETESWMLNCTLLTVQCHWKSFFCQ